MIAPVRSVYGFGRWSPATTNTMPSPATSINCASSEIASIDCGVTYWFAAVNARGRSGRSLLRSSKGGYHHPESCTHIPMLACTLSGFGEESFPGCFIRSEIGPAEQRVRLAAGIFRDERHGPRAAGIGIRPCGEIHLGEPPAKGVTPG